LVLGATAGVVAIVACEMQSPTAPRIRPVASKPTVVPAGQPYFEFQVEQPVTAAGSAQPRYPDVLRLGGVEGEVLVQFVVGADGRADIGSLKILKQSHEPFTQSVRNALPMMRFIPAKVGGKPVRQLVQQPFTFTLPK
jgi:protein TonB